MHASKKQHNAIVLPLNDLILPSRIQAQIMVRYKKFTLYLAHT